MQQVVSSVTTYWTALSGRSLSRANIPSTKEPLGLYRTDAKRPNGVTLTPWQAGKCLLWDATSPDTQAASHPRRYIEDSRSGSGTGSQFQNRKISRTDSQIHLLTGSRRNTRSNEQRRGKFLVWSWVTNRKDHSRSFRNQPHIPKNFGFGATGERLIVRRMFSGGGVVVGQTVFRLRGLWITGTVGRWFRTDNIEF